MQRLSLGALLLLASALFAPSDVRAVGNRPVSALPDPIQTRVAITQGFNVALINANGGGRRVVTSRGTGYNGTWYSKYAWSFDGKFMLLVKHTVMPNHSTRVDLLLLDSTGIVLRTLAKLPSAADFEPAWANDADQIAYVAWQKYPANSNKPYNAVNVVDLQGHKRLLWGYVSTGEGCGGGTGDPAAIMFNAETGFGGIPQSLQWSIQRHIAVYSPSCSGGLQATDLRSHQSRHLGRKGESWDEAALSRTGILAALARSCQSRACSKRIILVNTVSGALIGTASQGELPSWSPDSRTLYFTQRIPGKILQMHDALGNAVDLQTYSSSIWRADANGSHAIHLLSEDAFGFGPLSPTPDGRSLIYSRVDNVWELYNHRLPGNRYNGRLLRLYHPTVHLERFDSGRRPVIIAMNAGRPAVRP